MLIVVPDKPVYWAVMRGEVRDGGYCDLKITNKKFMKPRDACINCWGVVEPDMRVKNLGTNASVLKSAKKRAEMLDPYSDGWLKVG